MSRSDKLLERLKAKPKDFTYEELRRLMRNLDCEEDLGENIRLARGVCSPADKVDAASTPTAPGE